MSMPDPLVNQSNAQVTLGAITRESHDAVNQKVTGTLKVGDKEFTITAYVANDLDESKIKERILKTVDTYKVTTNTVSFSKIGSDVKHIYNTDEGAQKETRFALNDEAAINTLKNDIESLAKENGVKLPETLDELVDVKEAIANTKTALNKAGRENKDSASSTHDETSEPVREKSKSTSSNQGLQDLHKKLKDLKNFLFFKQFFMEAK